MKKANLKNLVKKDGKTFKLAYINAFEKLINVWNDKYMYWYDWRYTTRQEYRYHGTTSTIGKITETNDAHMASFLTACGVSFTRGNDAPRGGASGNYIAIKASDVKGIIRCVFRNCNVQISDIERGYKYIKNVTIY